MPFNMMALVYNYIKSRSLRPCRWVGGWLLIFVCLFLKSLKTEIQKNDFIIIIYLHTIKSIK